MATSFQPNVSHSGPSAPDQAEDLPPPYSAVVGNPQYGFVTPTVPPYTPSPMGYPPPKSFTAPGVYPHPPVVTSVQPQPTEMPQQPPGMSVPVGVVMSIAVGSNPTTVTCYSCGKVVTTKVRYSSAWHTHLVAGSICFITMVCSLCCLGLLPYCFDSFKDAEHYCPNCNAFIGKNSRC